MKEYLPYNTAKLAVKGEYKLDKDGLTFVQISKKYINLLFY